MDPRYQWPPQAYQNGQYPPPPQNGYQPNGYPAQYNQQPMPQGYPASQPLQQQPHMVVPPRPSQPYPPLHAGVQAPPRPMQAQVVIPPRIPNQIPAGQNPKIRQVQVPAQRSQQAHGQVQAAGNGVKIRDSVAVQPHPQQQPHAPAPKPVQRSTSQSHRDGQPRPQQRTPSTPSTNQNQHRAPLQPQVPPQQRTPSSQLSSSSQRTPSSSSQTPSKVHPQVVIKKPSHTNHDTNHVKSTPHNPPNALPADLSVLLLTMADEYVDAARGMGSVAAMVQREADLSQYYKLMSTGLGCMETILKRYNQNPRDEAKLRLRYASLLVEETDNDVEIEEVLTKGISLCARNRLLDLKYSMLHLQARYQFKSNHRAALKSLDSPISEAETFQHIVWVYAFRFLKVSLALQVPGRPETSSALQQLHAIANHAEKRGDRAIFVTCSALEAMIHLRTAGPDHLEHAQRAIAVARSLQLHTTIRELGQVAALIDCIDIACSLQQGRPDLQKMKALQQKTDFEPGRPDGIFSVLIEKSFGGNLTLSTGDVFTKAKDGRDELVFSWLPQKDLSTLAFFLSGVTSLTHDHKGPQYLKEGLKYTQDALHRPLDYGTSISTAVRQRNWITVLDWHMQFTMGLVACRFDDLPATQQKVTNLRKRIGQIPFNNSDTYKRQLLYLSAVLDQSRGALQSAQAIYALPDFALPAGGTHIDAKTDIAILATMNQLLIVRNLAHPDHFLMDILFSQLEPLCTAHPNQALVTAFRVIRFLTTIDPDMAINRQKTLVQNAISCAQQTNILQFIVICLGYMASHFFTDSVGEQPVKAVRAARSMSKQNRSVLWRAVALGLCINAFQKNGLWEDAHICQEQFGELVAQLPGPLKKVLEGQGHNRGSADVAMIG